MTPAVEASLPVGCIPALQPKLGRKTDSSHIDTRSIASEEAIDLITSHYG
jgi:hypothetical protein